MWLRRSILTKASPDSVRQTADRRRHSRQYRAEVSPLETRSLLSNLYATGSGVGDGTSHLYTIDSYSTSPQAVDIGSSGEILTDLAVNPANDAAFAVGPTFLDLDSVLYSINLQTGAATEIGLMGVSGMNALTFATDGTLYAMSSDTSELYSVNVTSGKATADFDTGFTSAGDLAFDANGALYLTSPTHLIRMNVTSHQVTDVGPLGVPGLDGLVIDGIGDVFAGQGYPGSSTAVMFSVNKLTGAATKIGPIANASTLGLTGLSWDYPSPPPPQPVVSLLSVETAPNAPSIDAEYAIDGSKLLPQGTIDFYWSTGGTRADEIGKPATVRVADAFGVHTIVFHVSDLGAQPASATGVLVVVDSPSADPNHELIWVAVSPPPPPPPPPQPPPPQPPPPQPIGGVHATCTVLKASPRLARFGRPVRLTATVENRDRSGGRPGGSVTFLDGGTVLRTVPLHGGRATYAVAGLTVGRNVLQVEYTPDNGFVSSSKAVFEIVRPQRSRGKAIPALEAAAAGPTGPRERRYALSGHRLVLDTVEGRIGSVGGRSPSYKKAPPGPL